MKWWLFFLNEGAVVVNISVCVWLLKFMGFVFKFICVGPPSCREGIVFSYLLFVLVFFLALMPFVWFE